MPVIHYVERHTYFNPKCYTYCDIKFIEGNGFQNIQLCSLYIQAEVVNLISAQCCEYWRKGKTHDVSSTAHALAKFVRSNFAYMAQWPVSFAFHVKT